MAFDFPDIQVGTTFGQTFSRQWQNMVEVVTKIDNLTVSHPLSLSTSQGSMRLEILDQPPTELIEPLVIRRFTIVNRDKDGQFIKPGFESQSVFENGEYLNYLSCQEYDPLMRFSYLRAGDVVQATKPVTLVYKAFGLRASDYFATHETPRVRFVRVMPSGTRVDYLPYRVEGSIVQNSASFRVANELDLPPAEPNTELQTIIPGYQPGISILAIKIDLPPNARIGFSELKWMDINLDGRAWAATGKPAP